MPVMMARLFLVIGVFVLGSEAAPFASRSNLKTAVDNCLAFDPTGVQCCGSAHDANCGDPATARCGAAGCDEMPSWNTSSVTSMRYMFRDATAFDADISGWNTSSVTNMEDMFYNAVAFNADISDWDTSSVTDMRFMFSGASTFDADISGWDTSSVTDMEGMFIRASAWLASYVRVDGSSSVDGPPSAWARSSPLPASPTPAPQPSPPPSLVFEDYSSGANRVAPLAFAASVVVVAAFARDSPF